MATQRLAPDGLTVQTNLTGSLANIDEDPDSPDASWLVATANNVSTTAAVTFPTPTGPPDTGAGVQEFRAQVRKFSSTQSGTPTVIVDLYENGTLLTSSSAVNVTSAVSQVVTLTWDASLLGTADGSLVECRVRGITTGGSPGVRNTVDVGAVEWNVVYTPAFTTHNASASLTVTAAPTASGTVVPAPTVHSASATLSVTSTRAAAATVTGTYYSDGFDDAASVGYDPDGRVANGFTWSASPGADTDLLGGAIRFNDASNLAIGLVLSDFEVRVRFLPGVGIFEVFARERSSLVDKFRVFVDPFGDEYNVYHVASSVLTPLWTGAVPAAGADGWVDLRVSFAGPIVSDNQGNSVDVVGLGKDPWLTGTGVATKFDIIGGGLEVDLISFSTPRQLTSSLPNTATITATASVVGGAVTHDATASLTVTAAPTGTGASTKPVTSTLAATSARVATAQRDANATATLTGTAARSGAATSTKPATSALTATVGSSTAVASTKPVASTLAGTASITAAANVGAATLSASASLAVTSASTSSAAATKPVASALAGTVALAGGAAATKPLGASLAGTSTRTAAADIGAATQSASAALTVTAGLASAAASAKPVTSSVTATASITASATVVKGVSAALTNTSTIAASAAVELAPTHDGAATSAFAVGIVASASVTRNAQASLGVTATLTPTVAQAMATTASLAILGTLAGTGAVVLLTTPGQMFPTEYPASFMTPRVAPVSSATHTTKATSETRPRQLPTSTMQGG